MLQDDIGPSVGMEKVLFVEVGFGNDQHGQDPTKACVRYGTHVSIADAAVLEESLTYCNLLDWTLFDSI